MASAKSLEKLSVTQLQTKLARVWKKYQRAAERTMAPLLYYLRKRVNAQGKKGSGFGVWVEDHLDISRRTADRWADDWAISKGLMKERKRGKTFRHLSKGKRDKPNPDGKEQVPLSFTLTTAEANAFWDAMKVLGSKAPRVIYEAVIAAANVYEAKKPSQPSQSPSIPLQDRKKVFIDDDVDDTLLGAMEKAKGASA